MHLNSATWASRTARTAGVARSGILPCHHCLALVAPYAASVPGYEDLLCSTGHGTAGRWMMPGDRQEEANREEGGH
eukprot:1711673-Rhodomonas_salina.4